MWMSVLFCALFYRTQFIQNTRLINNRSGPSATLMFYPQFSHRSAIIPGQRSVRHLRRRARRGHSCLQERLRANPGAHVDFVGLIVSGQFVGTGRSFPLSAVFDLGRFGKSARDCGGGTATYSVSRQVPRTSSSRIFWRVTSGLTPLDEVLNAAFLLS